MCIDAAVALKDKQAPASRPNLPLRMHHAERPHPDVALAAQLRLLSRTHNRQGINPHTASTTAANHTQHHLRKESGVLQDGLRDDAVLEQVQQVTISMDGALLKTAGKHVFESIRHQSAGVDGDRLPRQAAHAPPASAQHYTPIYTLLHLVRLHLCVCRRPGQGGSEQRPGGRLHTPISSLLHHPRAHRCGGHPPVQAAPAL